MRPLRLPFPLLLVLASASAFAQPAPGPPPFRVQRLSPRVALFTEVSPMENIVVAIASARGVVVVDSTGSPATAALLSRAVASELGRGDVTYLVNTHHHWDHAYGNQAFPTAAVIGHETCLAELRTGTAAAERLGERFQRQAEASRARLEEVAPGSEEAGQARVDLDHAERVATGLAAGFQPTPPTLAFNDRLTLDLGDLTLKMTFFGRAHSGSDILVQVPEEGLLITGDLFLDRGWLPLFAGQETLDVDRWVEVLAAALDGPDPVRWVVPGHRDPWDRDRLALWRDYIVATWAAARAAAAEGVDLATFIDRTPLPQRLGYLRERGFDDAQLARFHERNLTAYWRQLKQPASRLVAEAIAAGGTEAGIARYRLLREGLDPDVYFAEEDFNTLGYQLLGAGETAAAVAVFRLNVEAYPGSWNVHDSLGEALMVAGERDLAVASYRRSLELNPDNANGRQMLERLLAEAGGAPAPPR